MPHPLLIFSQSGCLIQIVAKNLHTWWQTVQIQISWLLQKPADLDLHCLQNRVYPGSTGLRLKCQENLYLKMSTVYVVCWIFLQTFQTYFCIQANSVASDQTVPRGAVWSGSTLFAGMQKIALRSLQEHSADDINRRHFQMQFFLAL